MPSVPALPARSSPPVPTLEEPWDRVEIVQRGRFLYISPVLRRGESAPAAGGLRDAAGTGPAPSFD